MKMSLKNLSKIANTTHYSRFLNFPRFALKAKTETYSNVLPDTLRKRDFNVSNHAPPSRSVYMQISRLMAQRKNNNKLIDM